MLSPFEKTRLQDVFRGQNSDSIIRAAAEFTVNPDKHALSRLETALKSFDCAKWTVVTYLPYLWRPDKHYVSQARGYEGLCCTRRPSIRFHLRGSIEH